MAAFRDGSIPNVAGTPTQAQLLVANPAEVFVLRTEAALRVFPETLAGELSVVVQQMAYVATVVRHPAAVQAITGAAYLASPTFA